MSAVLRAVAGRRAAPQMWRSGQAGPFLGQGTRSARAPAQARSQSSHFHPFPCPAGQGLVIDPSRWSGSVYASWRIWVSYTTTDGYT